MSSPQSEEDINVEVEDEGEGIEQEEESIVEEVEEPIEEEVVEEVEERAVEEQQAIEEVEGEEGEVEGEPEIGFISRDVKAEDFIPKEGKLQEMLGIKKEGLEEQETGIYMLNNKSLYDTQFIRSEIINNNYNLWEYNPNKIEDLVWDNIDSLKHFGWKARYNHSSPEYSNQHPIKYKINFGGNSDIDEMKNEVLNTINRKLMNETREYMPNISYCYGYIIETPSVTGGESDEANLKLLFEKLDDEISYEDMSSSQKSQVILTKTHLADYYGIYIEARYFLRKIEPTYVKYFVKNGDKRDSYHLYCPDGIVMIQAEIITRSKSDIEALTATKKVGETNEYWKPSGEYNFPKKEKFVDTTHPELRPLLQRHIMKEFVNIGVNNLYDRFNSFRLNYRISFFKKMPSEGKYKRTTYYTKEEKLDIRLIPSFKDLNSFRRVRKDVRYRTTGTLEQLKDYISNEYNII